MHVNKNIVVALLILLASIIAASGYLYLRIVPLQENTNAVATKEAEALVAVVGKLIMLPQDELPTVATVSDPSELSDQPFFAKAKVGDKVLFYTTARKAFLYDPVANKILEVAPLNLGEDAPQVSAEETPETAE